MEDSGTESDDETDKEEGDEDEEGDLSKLVRCYLIHPPSPSALTVYVWTEITKNNQINDRLLFT